jgi:acyl-ACP thioesterase
VFLPTVSSTFGAVERKSRTDPTEAGASTIVDEPTTGRTFSTSRRVSVADADPTGRMELDAVARFLQDTGNDDTDDAGLPALGLAWVARRAAIEVRHPASSREKLKLTTWCSGTGPRWAERRTSITGEQGARIEAAVIWVHLDATSGRPVPWGSEFATRYLEATHGRRVDAKLRHEKETPAGATSTPWSFRATDMDAFGHVNNAAYLAIAEELLELDASPVRIEVEWRGPSVAGELLTIWSATEDSERQLWVRSTTDASLRATIRKSALTD